LFLEKVTKAFAYALERHAGQLRKDYSTPYIVHPFRVFLWLADEAKVYDETVLASAFLHDLIEDTKTDYDELNDKFGKDVADIVATVSKDKRLPENTREKKFNDRLQKASWKAKIVKLADIYDNVQDMKNWRKGSRSEKISKLKEKHKQLVFIGKNLPDRYKPLLELVVRKLNQTQARMKQR
jgi:guanosine-3',5'-bis(diphosphate) 3'-pyrophosphohydrolase